MGATQGKQQIKEYLGKQKGGLTQSQDTRHVERIFKIYDVKKTGSLDVTQGTKFIDDVLSASEIKTKLIEQGGDDKNFYPAQVKAMFDELDSNSDGKIELSDILRPGMSGIHTLLGTAEIISNLFQHKDQQSFSTCSSIFRRFCHYCVITSHFYR
jgi:polyhydroxyalkanoate synthesis regulator phasin